MKSKTRQGACVYRLPNGELRVGVNEIILWHSEFM